MGKKKQGWRMTEILKRKERFTEIDRHKQTGVEKQLLGEILERGGTEAMKTCYNVIAVG